MFLLGGSAASVRAQFDGQWIDLTHEFSAETIYWSTADSFKKNTVFEGQTDKGYYYTAYNFTAAEHSGCHLDAPIGVFEGRHTVALNPVR